LKSRGNKCWCTSWWRRERRNFSGITAHCLLFTSRGKALEYQPEFRKKVTTVQSKYDFNALLDDESLKFDVLELELKEEV
jgi:hypothetical protein